MESGDCVTSGDWLFSLNIMLWRYTQIVCVSKVHSFSLLTIIPVCLTIHPLKDIWVVPSFWLL